MQRYRTEEDMRLLKEFAMAALPAIIQSKVGAHHAMAHEAYRYAEAMLERHNKVESTPAKSAA